MRCAESTTVRLGVTKKSLTSYLWNFVGRIAGSSNHPWCRKVRQRDACLYSVNIEGINELKDKAKG
jgi:hypothetical protein